jgi:CheY-like chemotaxis protein
MPRRKRVLVVDDDPAMLLALGGMVQSAGYTAVVESAPRQACALLAAGQRFDVILCDMMMPGMTGREVFDWISDEVPAQAGRFVLMSSNGIVLRSAGVRCGAAYLEKPIDVRVLKEVLDQLVGDAEDSQAPQDAGAP